MAEVTVAATFADTKQKRIGKFKARQFTIQAATTGDVFTSGIKGIQEVWHRGVTSDDQLYAAPNQTTGVITFTFGQAGTKTFQILVLSKG